MGKRYLRHPDAVLADISAKAALRIPKPLEYRWVVVFTMKNGTKRKSYGGTTREEALSVVRMVFDCDDADEYESAWIRRSDA